MSGLAHFLEDEGLSTVVVALVREHVLKMSPPRAIWVPFEMGRPFATPHDIDLQNRVLQAALDLFDQPGADPILRDYLEEASQNGGDPNWNPPTNLATGSARAEATSVLPLWESARSRAGKSLVGIGGLEPLKAIEFIDRYLSTDPMPNPKGMAAVSRARFTIDDIKVFYFEAALANGGQPSSMQLNDWFWNKTLAGKMILDFQDAARTGNDKNLNIISGSLVPPERTYEYRSLD